MSEDREAQEDELLALASIYDEDEFHRAESAQGGEIQLCLELPPDFKVVVKGTPVGIRILISCFTYKEHGDIDYFKEFGPLGTVASLKKYICNNL